MTKMAAARALGTHAELMHKVFIARHSKRAEKHDYSDCIKIKAATVPTQSKPNQLLQFSDL